MRPASPNARLLCDRGREGRGSETRINNAIPSLPPPFFFFLFPYTLPRVLSKDHVSPRETINSSRHPRSNNPPQRGRGRGRVGCGGALALALALSPYNARHFLYYRRPPFVFPSISRALSRRGRFILEIERGETMAAVVAAVAVAAAG